MKRFISLQQHLVNYRPLEVFEQDSITVLFKRSKPWTFKRDITHCYWIWFHHILRQLLLYWPITTKLALYSNRSDSAIKDEDLSWRRAKTCYRKVFSCMKCHNEVISNARLFIYINIACLHFLWYGSRKNRCNTARLQVTNQHIVFGFTISTKFILTYTHFLKNVIQL